MAQKNVAIKAKVRTQYIAGLPLDAAAATAKASYSTARNWKRAAKAAGDDWDVARTAKQISSGSVAEVMQTVIAGLAQQFAATIQTLEDQTDMEPMAKANILLKVADAFVKTMAAASKGNPKLDRLGTAMEVLQMLVLFISERYPEIRKQFIDVAEAFGPEVVRTFGAQE